MLRDLDTDEKVREALCQLCGKDSYLDCCFDYNSFGDYFHAKYCNTSGGCMTQEEAIELLVSLQEYLHNIKNRDLEKIAFVFDSIKNFCDFNSINTLT